MERSHTKFSPKIGEVYLMSFDGSGSEQGGIRPGLVFQNNVGNAHSPNIIALPLTSSIKKLTQPTHVLLRASECGLSRDSIVLCENPQRMSKSKIVKYLTTLPAEDMRRITEGNLLATSAISFLDVESIMRVWRDATKLNATA